MRNRLYREKQRTTDARRLMRPGTAVQGSIARATTDQYCQAGLNSRVSLGKTEPYEGLSRMKGNFHVRFLGGRGRATARAYPALRRGYGVATGGQLGRSCLRAYSSRRTVRGKRLAL
jgi:hypothetical protein